MTHINKKTGIGCNRPRAQHPGCLPECTNDICILSRTGRRSKGRFDDCSRLPTRGHQTPRSRSPR